MIAAPAAVAQDTFVQEMSGPGEATALSPEQWTNARTQHYELPAPDSRLTITTNTAAVEECAAVANVVVQSMAFVRNATGLDLRGDIQLYVMEFEQVPEFYRFEAQVPSGRGIIEVRFVALERGESMVGSPAMSRFLFETLPHELGHDALSRIPCIRKGTLESARWFEEGVSEVLAHRFTAQFGPNRGSGFKHTSSSRHEVGVVTVDDLYNWDHEKRLPASVEVDLYAHSFRAVDQITSMVPLPSLLRELALEKDCVRLTERILRRAGLSFAQLIDEPGLESPAR